MNRYHTINTYFKPVFLAVFAALMITGCKDAAKKENGSTMTNQKVTQADWGELDGKKVYLYTLANKNGVEVKITNYGGIITS